MVIAFFSLMFYINGEVGERDIVLSEDWAQDQMIVYIAYEDKLFTPIFIAPDNSEVNAEVSASGKYATYTINTSDKPGKWIMRYPKSIDKFTLNVY